MVMDVKSRALCMLQNFRYNELNSLKFHVKRFGELPTRAAATANASASSSSSTTPGTVVAARALTPPEPGEPAIPEPVRLPNPFLPQKNALTGRWAPPKYSIRQQVELIKVARLAGRLDVLPPGPKLTPPSFASMWPHLSPFNLYMLRGNWEQDIEWVSTSVDAEKKEVKDGGVRLYEGKKRMFKGHKRERLRPKKAAHRAQLLRDMPQRVEEYKQVRVQHQQPFHRQTTDFILFLFF